MPLCMCICLCNLISSSIVLQYHVIQHKINQYTPLMTALTTQGWKIQSLIILTVGQGEECTATIYDNALSTSKFPLPKSNCTKTPPYCGPNLYLCLNSRQMKTQTTTRLLSPPLCPTHITTHDMDSSYHVCTKVSVRRGII